MTDEQLAVEIRRELAAAAEAREQGDEEQARRHEERVTQLKHELWARLEPRVRQLAGHFLRRRLEALAQAGLEFGDLISMAQEKFSDVIGNFDSNRRVLLWTFLEPALRNHLIDAIRRSRQELRETVEITKKHEETIADEAAPSVEEEAERHIWRKQVRQAVDDVCWRMLQDGYDPARMLAFRLYHLWEVKMQDIAWWMGRSLGWVHNAIHDTEEAFRVAFAERYPDIVREYNYPQPPEG